MEDEAKTREELLAEVRRLRGALASLRAPAADGSERSLLEALAQLTPSPIYVYGLDRRLRYANRAWEELNGVGPGEAIGKSIEEFYPADVAQGLLAVTRLVAASAMPLTAEESVVVGGNQRVFQSAKLPIFDAAGNVEAVGGVSIDVTARKRADEELRRTRESLQATIGAAPLAIIAIDAARRVTVWNAAAERTFGWSAEEITGQLLPHIPDSRREESAGIFARLLAGEPSVALETERLHREGHPVHVNLSVAPLDRCGGRQAGYVAIAEDITARKRAEQELLEAYRREQMLGEYGRSFVVRYTVSPTMAVQYVSPSCLAITGYTQAEFAADPTLFFQRAHPDDQVASFAVHGGRHPIAYRPLVVRWLTKSGEVIWLERRDVAVQGEGGALTAETIVQDVTQRMRAKEATHGASGLATSLPGMDPVVLLRLRLADGPHLTWISESVKQATGFPAASFLDDRSFWLERVHPAERSQLLNTLDPQAGAESRPTRFGWRCADETYRWFEARRLQHPPVAHAADEVVVAVAPSSGSTAQAAAPSRLPARGGGQGSDRTHWKRLLIRLPSVMAVPPDKPLQCPKCHSPEIVRHDRQIRRIDGGRAEVEVIRYRCRVCGANLTWRPAGVDRTLQGEALRRLTQVLYGLGLSKRQVSAILGNAGVSLSPGTVWRNARGAGERMRLTLPAGSRCLLPQDPTPTGVDFCIIDKLEVAGPGVPQTALSLLLWDQSGAVLAWLQTHLHALGLECDVTTH